LLSFGQIFPGRLCLSRCCKHQHCE
jgi:hypothetical protein